MPLYEYVCQSCHQQFELLVRGDQEPACPECGDGELTRLLSVVAAPGRSAAGGAAGGEPPGSCGPGCCCHGGG